MGALALQFFSVRQSAKKKVGRRALAAFGGA
jgi:hypothetical protein